LCQILLGRGFAKERRAAVLLQAGATVVGVFLPVTAVVFYLAVSVLSIIELLRHIRGWAWIAGHRGS